MSLGRGGIERNVLVVQNTKWHGHDNGISYEFVANTEGILATYADRFGSCLVPGDTLDNFVEPNGVVSIPQGVGGPIDNHVVTAFHVEISLRDEIAKVLGRRRGGGGADPEFDFSNSLWRPHTFVLCD